MRRVLGRFVRWIGENGGFFLGCCGSKTLFEWGSLGVSWGQVVVLRVLYKKEGEGASEKRQILFLLR